MSAAKGMIRVAFGIALLGATVSAWATDSDEDQVAPELRDLRQKLAGVQEWQGVWEVRNFGAVNSNTPPNGYRIANYEEKTHGSFLLKRYMRDWEPRRGNLSWQGDGEDSGRGQGTYAYRESGTVLMAAEDWAQHYQGSMPQLGIKFDLSFGGKRRSVNLHNGSMNQQDEVRRPHRIRTGRKLSRMSGNDPFSEYIINESDPVWMKRWSLSSGMVDSKLDWPVVESGATVLEFTYECAGDSPVRAYNDLIPGMRKRSRVLMFPIYDNLEVEVTIEGYDDWRPKGTVADPKKPGNKLVARATLKAKDGKPASDLPPVHRFIFELKDTSREPGICLNWPLNAKDSDPDLRLATGPLGGELSKEDQKLIVTMVPTDDAGRPYSEAQIDSYDFGGRAELRVTCELNDGREITGLIKDDKGGEDLVRLPKMNGPGWIAEGWLKKKGVTDLADNDDEEKVEGQDYKGDGFTLYEEYRGFVENGVRVEGDPKKKDLFILNLADVATRSGVSLFEQLSKVKAHGRLRDGKEMTQEDRVMNGNHRDAPHRVDQHGVVLSHEGLGKGGYTAKAEGADDKKAFRPRYTSLVYIEPPDAAFGLFSDVVRKRYTFDHLDGSQLYAAAVAHELLHSIGTDHHGESRMEIWVGYFQAADNPKNSTHRPRFTDDHNSSTVLTLLWEDTGESVANDQQLLFNDYVTRSPAGSQAAYRDAVEYWVNFPIYAGLVGGTDSGDEACVMRYYFATAYAAKGKKNTFYVMRPGMKQLETKLCTDAKGTGGNAASHQPQPRFGDAAGGRGDCFSQICPNDAIPPRNIAIK